VFIVAQVLPDFVGDGVRRIAGNRLETLLLEPEEEVDPNNPFNAAEDPAGRSADHWRWLAENASSIAEAERLSGCAKNTIRKYFRIHGLAIDRSRSPSSHPQ
jgi:hypothetical protein